MNERIRKVRKALNISQNEFAESLNLKRNSISLIEVGKRNPSDRTISDICRRFNVSEKWLREGDGDMFIKTPAGVMEQLKKEFQLDDFSYNLVYEYLKLDQPQRKAVRDFFYRVIELEENVDLIGEAPGTPEELERQFPPDDAGGAKTG